MIKILLHLNMSVPIRPNNSSTSPGVVPGVRLGVRCPNHPRSELVGRWRRHGRRRQACSIQCPSAGRCRFARDVPPPTNDDPAPADVAPLAAGVAPPTGCVGWVPTGDACVNCDGPTSSTCGASMVARMSHTQTHPSPGAPRWSRRNQLQRIVLVLQNVSYLTNFTVKLWLLPGWNIGRVNEEGISAAANWKTDGLKPHSGKINALGAVVSGCQDPTVGNFKWI
jgi:hypothetical protein